MARWAILVVLALGVAGCSSPPEVEVLSPTRGDLRRSFSEQARTRLSRTWTVRMPVTGRMSRIELEPGDRVRAGQDLARVDRVPLEARVAEGTAQVEEARARAALQQDVGVEAAQAAEARARARAEQETARALGAEVRSAEAALAQAEREARRQEGLFHRGFVARQQAEQARLEATSARQRLVAARERRDAQQAAVAAAGSQAEALERAAARRQAEEPVLQAQLEGARARLREAAHEAGQAVVEAPVSGVVLERFEQGPGSFQAGTKLLDLGRLEDLEAVAEVLTGDALALEPGTPVELEAGGRRFAGRVTRLDPAGFTKQSSLGVEQQRVDVIMALEDAPDDLGVAYQLQATFVTETKRDVLQIPRFSVLQAPDGGYFVFRVEQGVLQRRPVKIGIQGDLRLEVLEGLQEGDTVVAVPDATLEEGRKVTPVPAPGT